MAGVRTDASVVNVRTNAHMLALARRALHHQQAGTTDQAAAVLELPVAMYTDPTRYRHEIQRVFRELPMGVALSLELPGPGSYRALNIMDVPVLIVRGGDGVVRAFLNVCRHRGAQVCADGSGTARVFSCPYHAWVYDQKGQLTGRYGADSFGEIDVDRYGLVPLACAEAHGVIWAMLTPHRTFDINRWLGGMGEQLDTLKLDTWHLYTQRDIPGPGWKVTMDGYLESYHHNLVHPKTVGQYTVGNLLVLDTWGPHQRLTFGRKSLPELLEQPESAWEPDVHIRLIHSCFPNLSLSGILGDHCLVSQIFPGPTPETTITRQTVLVARQPETDAEKAATEAFSALTLKAVEEEDYGIGFGIQKAVHAGANEHFLIGRNEPAIQNYHRWVAYFARANAGTEW
ncbi:MAG: aromatic ring-hydroxylating dioxygenase subunit alpha [Pseudomonadales bacterium]|nr:aromatic ring-hydroxylating dioxygenase subunit alpha [Pseudomonadales bacterium]MCP5182306.1 aromatic ring-hydroxylating dioxygenase subunit alpha [Pseudomonadales bacterium]